MRQLSPLLFLILISFRTASFAQAQQPSDWIPDGISTLQQNASSKSELTFDHSMLVLASKLDPDNEDLRRVIAGVSGISVRSYRFAGPGQYDRTALTSVAAEYRAAGWTELMNRKEKSNAPGETDLWVRLDNNAISDVAILLARATDVKFVMVSGSISPLDISHLGGHFGIPKLEGGVRVPSARRQ